MYKYWKESKLWVWNWASLDQDQASVWTADTSGFRQAWDGDALCMYIGLLMGELREAEPIRNPSQDIVVFQFTAWHTVSLCIWWVFLQNHSIVAFVLI